MMAAVEESSKKRMKQSNEDSLSQLDKQHKMELFQLIETRKDIIRSIQRIQFCVEEHFYSRAQAEKDYLDVEIDPMNWKDYLNEEVEIHANSKMSSDLLILQLVKLSNNLTHHTQMWRELTKGMSRSDIDALYEEESKRQATRSFFERIKSDWIFLDLVDQFRTYSSITHESSEEDVLTEQMKNKLRTEVTNATDYHIHNAFVMYCRTLKLLYRAELRYNFRMFLLRSNFKMKDDLDTIMKHDEFNRQNFNELFLLQGAVNDYKDWLMNPDSYEAKLLLYEKAAKDEWEQMKAKEMEDLFATPLLTFLLEARKRGHVFNADADDPEEEILRMKNCCPDLKELFKS